MMTLTNDPRAIVNKEGINGFSLLVDIERIKIYF